jgi:hypothetical protein
MDRLHRIHSARCALATASAAHSIAAIRFAAFDNRYTCAAGVATASTGRSRATWILPKLDIHTLERSASHARRGHEDQ